MADPIVTQRPDKDGVTITESRIRKAESAVTASETIVGGVWKKIEFVPDTGLAGWEVTTSRTIPGNDVTAKEFDGDNSIITRTRRFVQLSTITPSEVVSGGNSTRIYSEPVSELVGWKITDVKPLYNREGQDYDERFDVVMPFGIKLEAAGTSIGVARKEVRPLSDEVDQTKSPDLTAIEAVLNSYLLQYPGRVNVDMPDILTGISAVMESSTGEGSQDETGSVAFTGSYSISQSLRASAQSSATILPDAIATIKQFWGNSIKSTNFQFFLLSPVTPTDITDKLTELLGESVSEWPKFNPQMITITGVGKRASLQVVATSQGSASASTGGSSSTSAGGTGSSREVGLSLKTIRISPTIHAEITVGGTTSETQSISATATAEATGLGPAETITDSEDVDASVSPTTIPATPGATTWPTTGKYLYRLDAQPYRFGYIQFHCVVIDAADFPSS